MQASKTTIWRWFCLLDHSYSTKYCVAGRCLRFVTSEGANGINANHLFYGWQVWRIWFECWLWLLDDGVVVMLVRYRVWVMKNSQLYHLRLTLFSCFFLSTRLEIKHTTVPWYATSEVSLLYFRMLSHKTFIWSWFCLLDHSYIISGWIFSVVSFLCTSFEIKHATVL